MDKKYIKNFSEFSKNNFEDGIIYNIFCDLENLDSLDGGDCKLIKFDLSKMNLIDLRVVKNM